MHLLGVGGKGVNVCKKLTMLQKSKILRMQMVVDANGTFYSQNFMCQAY